MGWNDRMEEDDPRFHAIENKHICTNCAVDSHLQKNIESNISGEMCSYCGNEDAAMMEEILPSVRRAILRYYGDADSLGVPFVEGEYLIQDEFTCTLIEPIDPGWPENVSLDIVESIDQGYHWVDLKRTDWDSLRIDNPYQHQWDYFKYFVLYESRFFFSIIPEEFEYLEESHKIFKGDYLKDLSKMITELGLYRTVSEGELFYRVRVHTDGAPYESFESISVAPIGAPRSGRMNPPGIPYLYLASNEQTAKAETIDDPNRRYAIGSFQIKKSIQVIDFTNIKEELKPSEFNFEEGDPLSRFEFLRGFAREIIEPINKDGKEHFEYVPTQIVSEFLRHFHTIGESRIFGIQYESSKRTAGTNTVFFFTKHEDVEAYFSLAEVRNE